TLRRHSPRGPTMPAHRLARAVAIALAFLIVAIASLALADKPSPSAAPAASLPPAASAPPGLEEALTWQWKPGPEKVDLGHDLDIDLPEPYVFLGMPYAGKMLEKFGTFHNENLLGVITGKDESADWLVTVRYEEEGYVKDDETVDADELLKAIRE